jgi:ParB family chromosome partitioning protein
MPGRGRRVNLSELADEETSVEARLPGFAASTSRAVRVETVAPNPLNTRDLTSPRAKAKIAEICDSILSLGQLQACAVVTRAAFVGIFPEHEDTIEGATHVQVNGGQRRAAIVEAKLPTIKIDVIDSLAESRAKFLAATTRENLDREDLDPVEEALAVEYLVKECGSGKAAAEQLHRTPPWVTQRQNLLKLVPEVQAELRAGNLPLREVRDWHKAADGSGPASREEQLARLAEWRRSREPELTAVNSGDQDDAPDEDPPAPRSRVSIRLSPVASAIKRLGGTPPKIAESLRSQLDAEDIRALVELLMQEGHAGTADADHSPSQH